jgi:LPS-assembly lipoprotein
MWWSRTIAVAVVAGLLGGCGFRPAYAPAAVTGSKPASENLAAIEIERIPDRIGQELRNHLLDVLTPRGQPDNPAYELKVTLNESRSDRGLAETGLATRAIFRLDANFSLVDKATGNVVMYGSTIAVSTYNITTVYFANVTAENNARTETARRIASNIRTRLSAYFSK